MTLQKDLFEEPLEILSLNINWSFTSEDHHERKKMNLSSIKFLNTLYRPLTQKEISNKK